MHYFGQQAKPTRREPTPEEKNFLLMKAELKGGNSCLEGELYNAVRDSSAAMKYYCEFNCNLYRRAKNPNYIQTRYGSRGERLGAGSFGVVYKYVNASGKEFAIKIPKSFKYKELFEELNASACLKKKLDSLFLKKMGIILECVSPPKENPHLIMRYFEKTLEDKMKEAYSRDVKYSSEAQKESLFYDMYTLAAEMRQLHENGLAHRDFKPENAMIDEQNMPVLVDFGLTTPNLLGAKTVCGTPLFLDPELITYKNTGGATADVYALGITFYIMMAGDAGWDNVNSMAQNGGYGTLGYNPNFNQLGLNGEKAFIINMLISSKKRAGRDSRWNMEQVYQYLKKIVIENNERREKRETQIQLDRQNQEKEALLQKQRQEEETRRQQEYQLQIQKQQSRPAQVTNMGHYQKQYAPSPSPLVNQYDYSQRPQRDIHIPTAHIPVSQQKVPYYQPVHHGLGENLDNYNQYVNRQQIYNNVKVYYGKPRVVKVIKYLV